MMRFSVAAAVCGQALLWIIATPQLSMPRRLFWITRRHFWSVTTDTCVDCGALRHEVHRQNAFSVPKHCAHYVPSWIGLFEFHLCWWWSVPPLHELLLQFRGFVWHQCLVPFDYMAQEVFAFLTVSCQKVQRTGMLFQFVFFRKHLRHPVCTRFREEVTMKFEEMQGKWHNGESSVLSNLLFNCTHQIFIHHRRSAALQIIMHIFPSSLNSRTHLCTTEILMAYSPYVTMLTMNFIRFHVLHIQETDYRPHFVCGGILHFLKHYKHTAQCINTVRMSVNCVCALPQNQQTRHAYAPSWPWRCSSNIHKRNLFLDNPHIW